MKLHLCIAAAALALAACDQGAQTANNEAYNESVAEAPSATSDVYPSQAGDPSSDGERPSGEVGSTDPGDAALEPVLPEKETTPP